MFPLLEIFFSIFEGFSHFWKISDYGELKFTDNHITISFFVLFLFWHKFYTTFSMKNQLLSFQKLFWQLQCLNGSFSRKFRTIRLWWVDFKHQETYLSISESTAWKKTRVTHEGWKKKKLRGKCCVRACKHGKTRRKVRFNPIHLVWFWKKR